MRQRDIATWIPFAILGGTLGIIFYRLILGNVLFWGPASLQYYPWRQFAFNELRQGRFPFWNPWVGAGTPLMANYQSAILYPPNWLHLVVHDSVAMSLLTLFHVIWTALGIWLFTRELGLSVLGRSVSMLCFALGSYSLNQIDAFPLANTTAWLPWLFWATLGVLDKRRLQYVGILGILSGLQLLAGHLQTSWYSFLALGIFTLWYVIYPLRPLDKGDRFSAFFFMLVALLIGAGIASTQLILTLEFLFNSRRAGGVDFSTLATESYPPWQLITLIAPHIIGSPADGTYLVDPQYSPYYVISLYIGFLPLILVISAVQGWLKRRGVLSREEVFTTVPFWLFLSLLGIFLSFGNFLPIYRVLYDYVPTFDGFRGPVRWLVLPAFGLSVLAGVGIHTWQSTTQLQQRVRSYGALFIGLLALLGVSVFAFSFNFKIERAFLLTITTWMIVTAGSIALVLTRPSAGQPGRKRWQATVLIFIALDLAWANYGKIPTISGDFFEKDLSVTRPTGRLYWEENRLVTLRDTQYFDIKNYRSAKDHWASLRTSLLPNLNMLDRISLFNNFDALQSVYHRRYIDLIEHAGENLVSILQAGGIGETIGTPQPSGWEGGLGRYNAPVSPPDVFFVHEVFWVGEDAIAEDFMRRAIWQPSRTVILHEDFLPGGYLPYPEFSEARVETMYRRPNEHRYRVQSDGSGYLVLPVTWYPGWEAKINNRSTRLYRANLAFMAVEVPEGDTEVVFRYVPNGIEMGIAIGLLSLCMALVMIAYEFFQL